MGQCDCHNYNGDLYAEREHGETVNLETESQNWGEGTLCSLLRQHTLGHEDSQEGRKEEKRERKKEPDM